MGGVLKANQEFVVKPEEALILHTVRLNQVDPWQIPAQPEVLHMPLPFPIPRRGSKISTGKSTDFDRHKAR